jgi:signal peptidase II
VTETCGPKRRFTLKRYLRDYASLLAIAFMIVTFDQWTKMLVRTNLAFGDMWSPWPWLTPYLRIVHWKNTGAAFGMLPGLGDVFTVLAVIVAVAILYYYPRIPREDWYLRLAKALQFGGALGNFIDRLLLGSVTDIVSIGPFPVFNVADACITMGTVILIAGMWYKERVGAPEDDSPSPESANAPVAEELKGE